MCVCLITLKCYHHHHQLCTLLTYMSIHTGHGTETLWPGPTNVCWKTFQFYCFEVVSVKIASVSKTKPCLFVISTKISPITYSRVTLNQPHFYTGFVNPATTWLCSCRVLAVTWFGEIDFSFLCVFLCCVLLQTHRDSQLSCHRCTFWTSN